MRSRAFLDKVKCLDIVTVVKLLGRRSEVVKMLSKSYKLLELETDSGA
jgi:hypothetical protein